MVFYKAVMLGAWITRFITIKIGIKIGFILQRFSWSSIGKNKLSSYINLEVGALSGKQESNASVQLVSHFCAVIIIEKIIPILFE